MIPTRELDVHRALDLVCRVTGLSLQDDRIVLPVDHQGGDVGRRQDVADVHVREDPPELLEGARACNEPLEPRPPPDETLVGSDGRRLQRQVLPGPNLADEPFEEHPLFFGGLAVRESGVETVFATGAYSTSALVRSGWVAAKSVAIVAARAPPNTIASADPAASITAPTSSRCSSSTGGSGPRSESPTPRKSNRISRENFARRSRKWAHVGSSHISSTFDQIPLA